MKRKEILVFKTKQQGLQPQYGLRSQQDLSGSKTHPILGTHSSKPVGVMVFFAAHLLQLTVDDHSG